MITFSYVEDYIEYIAGYREITGQLSNNWFAATYLPVLSLARYDVRVINSIGTQTIGGVALTDRQAELAVKIITKYTKQLAALGISTEPLAIPVFRMAQRKIDRHCRAWMEQEIYLQFPFNADIIDHIRQERTASQGSIAFNRNGRKWVFAPTEYNVSLAHQLAHQYHFDIDETLQQAMQEVLTVEAQGYAIELRQDGQQLLISNAPQPLIDYVNGPKMCGFGLDNLAKLVDCAPILGYTVNDTLRSRVAEQYGSFAGSLMQNKDSNIELENETAAVTVEQLFGEIVKYATCANRWPIFVNDPTPHVFQLDLKLLISQYAQDSEIIWADKVKRLAKVDPKIKFVYFSKKISVDDELTVPLLVSTIGMYFGGQKQLLLQQAQKVVYFTTDVYNKLNRNAEKITFAPDTN